MKTPFLEGERGFLFPRFNLRRGCFDDVSGPAHGGYPDHRRRDPLFRPPRVERTFCDVSKELKKLSEEREKSVGYAKIAKVSFKKQPRS